MNMAEEPFRLYNHDEYDPIFGHQARDFLGKTINLIKHHKQTIWEKPGAAPFSPFSPRYVVGWTINQSIKTSFPQNPPADLAARKTSAPWCAATRNAAMMAAVASATVSKLNPPRVASANTTITITTTPVAPPNSRVTWFYGVFCPWVWPLLIFTNLLSLVCMVKTQNSAPVYKVIPRITYALKIEKTLLHMAIPWDAL